MLIQPLFDHHELLPIRRGITNPQKSSVKLTSLLISYNIPLFLKEIPIKKNTYKVGLYLTSSK